jgi:hypothetical protein
MKCSLGLESDPWLLARFRPIPAITGRPAFDPTRTSAKASTSARFRGVCRPCFPPSEQDPPETPQALRSASQGRAMRGVDKDDVAFPLIFGWLPEGDVELRVPEKPGTAKTARRSLFRTIETVGESRSGLCKHARVDGEREREVGELIYSHLGSHRDGRDLHDVDGAVTDDAASENLS